MTKARKFTRNIITKVPGVGILQLTGDGAPSDSKSGYAPGCIYQDLTNGVTYVNRGTKSSSTWESTSTFTVQKSNIQGDGTNNEDVIFIAPRKCEVKAVREIHSTVAGQAGELNIERLQGTETPGGGNGDALLTDNSNAGFDLTATVDTVQSGTLVTDDTQILSAGDRLGLNVSNNDASLAGCCVTIEMAWLE